MALAEGWCPCHAAALLWNAGRFSRRAPGGGPARLGAFLRRFGDRVWADSYTNKFGMTYSAPYYLSTVLRALFETTRAGGKRLVFTATDRLKLQLSSTGARYSCRSAMTGCVPK